MLKNLFALTLIILITCANQCNKKSAAGLEMVVGKVWKHSQEEDKDGIMVYRTADYNFPPSRGREGFEMKKDGTFVLMHPGANDAPQTSEGTWKMDKNISIELTKGEKKGTSYALEVVESTKDMLKVKRAN